MTRALPIRCHRCGRPWLAGALRIDHGRQYIVFDGPPSADAPDVLSHTLGRFVEIEAPPGTSIKLGTWVKEPVERWCERTRGGPFLWRLRITLADLLANLPAEPFDPTVLPEGWTRHPAPNYEFSATYRYTSRPLTMTYLPSGKLEVQRWVQRPHGEEYEWETEEPEGSDLVLAGRALEALGRHLERVQAEAMNKAHGWEDKR